MNRIEKKKCRLKKALRFFLPFFAIESIIISETKKQNFVFMSADTQI